MAASRSLGPSMTVKIYVDKKKNRVVFAEAKDFVDFIFHILSLPIGTVHRILAKTSTTILGSISTLQGLKNLDDQYLEDPGKDYLLDLKAPYCVAKALPLCYLKLHAPSPDNFTNVPLNKLAYVWRMRCSHYNCWKPINLVGKALDIGLRERNSHLYGKDLLNFKV